MNAFKTSHVKTHPLALTWIQDIFVNVQKAGMVKNVINQFAAKIHAFMAVNACWTIQRKQGIVVCAQFHEKVLIVLWKLTNTHSDPEI